MKTRLSFFFAFLFTVALIKPAEAQVKSDYDKNADFSKYKTYSFLGWQDNSDKILNDFDKKRIHDAFMSEFAKRGMTYVESGGDASISLFLVVNKETSTTAYTDFNTGYGYRGRWGWGMGPGYATTTYQENDYLQGTMVCDMYDTQSKNLLWQGIIKKTVEEKPEKREKSIPKNVTKLMKKFPVKPSK